MKRSEVNQIMRDGVKFLHEHGFLLPRFAYWGPTEWATKGEEVREILDREYGWDITDFGSGDYYKVGLFIFTVRNSDPSPNRPVPGKVYAEKFLICDPKQVTPMHFHWRKVEDIINRGGGDLMIQVYNSTPEEGLADTDVLLNLDGVRTIVKAGEIVCLKPGDSITIPNFLYHSFWGEGERVLVGEVSLANDDNVDNRFYKEVGRFPEVEEDEAPLYLLVKDYLKYYRG